MNEYVVYATNELIKQAFYHGGDRGGPYASNEDGLRAAMQKYLSLTGADFSIVKDREGCLQFAKVVFYKTEDLS